MDKDYHSQNEKLQSTEKVDRLPHNDPPIDFWSSRGNMGEKINFLVGLNLLQVSLLSALVQSLSTSNLIDTEISSELERIKNFIYKMLNQPTAQLDLGANIRDVDSKISTILKELEDTNNQLSIPQRETQFERIENTVGIFNKTSEVLDKWGILESIESLMATYANLSHLAFPKFYLFATKELLHYELNEEYSRSDQKEIFQIPIFKISSIISKLLREAPAARLLQNLRHFFPLETDENIKVEEITPIQENVEKYFLNVSNYLKGERTLQDSLRASTAILQGYNLGTGDLESRIPNVSFIVAKDVQTESEQLFGNEFKQLILSETIILIHRLNNSTLQNERFVSYLKRLK